MPSTAPFKLPFRHGLRIYRAIVEPTRAPYYFGVRRNPADYHPLRTLRCATLSEPVPFTFLRARNRGTRGPRGTLRPWTDRHPLRTFRAETANSLAPSLDSWTAPVPADPPRRLERERPRILLLIDVLRIPSYPSDPRLLTPSLLRPTSDGLHRIRVTERLHRVTGPRVNKPERAAS